MFILDMLDLSLDVPFLGFSIRSAFFKSRIMHQNLIFCPQTGREHMVDVAGLGNEGLGTISLSEGRKADKDLPLWAAPQPPTVL